LFQDAAFERPRFLTGAFDFITQAVRSFGK